MPRSIATNYYTISAVHLHGKVPACSCHTLSIRMFSTRLYHTVIPYHVFHQSYYHYQFRVGGKRGWQGGISWAVASHQAGLRPYVPHGSMCLPPVSASHVNVHRVSSTRLQHVSSAVCVSSLSSQLSFLSITMFPYIYHWVWALEYLAVLGL